MTTDLIIDAFTKLQEISFVKVWRSIRNGWYDQEIEFRKERAVALIDGQLVATGKKKYTGEDGRMSAASKKALMVNNTPLPIELLALSMGSTQALRDILPFSGYTGGFQKIEDETLHSSEKLDAILGEGNYTFMVTYGDYSHEKCLYIKIDIVNEYTSEEELTEADLLITEDPEEITVAVDTTVDMVCAAIETLEDLSYTTQRRGAKIYKKYNYDIVISADGADLVIMQKIDETQLNDTPLDIGILEMAKDRAELKDLLAFSNYNPNGFQLLADTEYYSSVTLDSIFGADNYTFMLKNDWFGDYALYIKIAVL